jgi:hypothetical protein
MRIRIAPALLLAVLLCPAAAPAQTAQVVQHDKTIDVSKFKTYSFETGHPAILEEVDRRILAALEKQLAAKGLQKAEAGQADAIVTYHAVQRQDVDLTTFDKAKAAGQAPAMLKVGAMAVDLKDAATAKLAWRAKVEDVLRGDQAAQLATIDKAIAALFEKYPAAAKK